MIQHRGFRLALTSAALGAALLTARRGARRWPLLVSKARSDAQNLESRISSR